MTDRSHWQRCNHERTPENSSASGRGSETCKTCKTARDKVYGRRGGRASAAAKKERKRRLPIRRTLPWQHLVSSPDPFPVPEDQSGRQYSQFFPRKFA